MEHDPLCYVAMNGGNCCPWMPECDCQCMCDFIKEVRNDTLASLTGLGWYSKARWTGYYEGIDAAEAAVAVALPHNDYCKGEHITGRDCNCSRFDALAAIRALKEKS